MISQWLMMVKTSPSRAIDSLFVVSSVVVGDFPRKGTLTAMSTVYTQDLDSQTIINLSPGLIKTSLFFGRAIFGIWLSISKCALVFFSWLAFCLICFCFLSSFSIVPLTFSIWDLFDALMRP